MRRGRSEPLVRKWRLASLDISIILLSSVTLAENVHFVTVMSLTKPRQGVRER